MRPNRSPFRILGQALDDGFTPVDVRSHSSGLEVALRRGDETRTVHLSREDARKIVSGDGPEVHALFR